jgi:hypothetical protein
MSSMFINKVNHFYCLLFTVPVYIQTPPPRRQSTARADSLARRIQHQQVSQPGGSASREPRTLRKRAPRRLHVAWPRGGPARSAATCGERCGLGARCHHDGGTARRRQEAAAKRQLRRGFRLLGGVGWLLPVCLGEHRPSRSGGKGVGVESKAATYTASDDLGERETDWLHGGRRPRRNARAR